ncbi:hypothetical protein ACFLZX_03645 [Nanoarchaeota archaeon]
MPHTALHIHQRIRKIDPKKIKLLDNICLITAILMPLTATPQIYKIWVYQNASGVSLLMWALYSILIIPMFFYSVVHRARPLIILNLMWFLFSIAIIVGVILYG